ncbi:MAG: nitroreductase family protein [Thermomicrobiales bacterium]
MIEAPQPTPPAQRTVRLDEAITGRRSVRGFLTDPVPKAVIESAIEAAGWAPSPHGTQPWRFVVIESPAERERLAETMAADWQRQLELDNQDAATVETRLIKGTARLIDAPVVVLVCLYLADLEDYPDDERQTAETTMAIQSLGAAIQNFLLSVYVAGYDAGWMCAPLFCPDLVRKTLGLPSSLIPHALVPVGVAAREPVRRARRPIETLIVDWL